MDDLYTQIITTFLVFFAIMNPIANTAAFAGLAGNKDKTEQFKIAAKALMITFFVSAQQTASLISPAPVS